MGIVYMATSKTSNKKYIGKTVEELDKRKRRHYRAAFYHNKSNHFYKASRKYGWDDFEWKIIYESDDNADLLEIEEFMIGFLNTRRDGYNMTNGGEGSFGFNHTKESKIKMSKSAKGKVISSETRLKISLANKNKKRSKDTCEKIAEANRKRNLSQETKNKISKSLIGRKHDNETKKKISESTKGVNNPFYGRKHSEETKEKMRSTRLKKSFDNNTKSQGE